MRLVNDQCDVAGVDPAQLRLQPAPPSSKCVACLDPPPLPHTAVCPVAMCTLSAYVCAASRVCECRYPDFLKDVGSTERLRARFAVLLSLNERLGPLLSLVDVTVRRQSLVGPCHAGTNQAAPKLRV